MIKHKTVKVLCETRWVERHTSLGEFEEIFVALSDCLQHIGDNASGKWDPKGMLEAKGLLAAVSSPSFLVSFCSTKYVFGYTKALGPLLQRTMQDMLTAYQEVGLVIDELKACRENAEKEFDENVWQQASMMATDADVEAMAIPRRCGRQTTRDNLDMEEPVDYWRCSSFIPLLDRIISELESRFRPMATKAIRAVYLLPQFLDSLTNDDVEQVKEYFGNGLPDKHTFDQEIRPWKRKWSEILTATRPSTLHDALETTNKHMYPNIHTIFSILLVMPVSSATVERGNSALKYI
ncbi:52 kDa repressor of the inhibitor of the protein kinase-like [Mizuhopecten yessoensis]|uniref:52 kDa repressor of the inhibitor of the protein kinase-like n=1 Tax=Mizuhopecten yessoensis TaxID=6573 RepID=UPI000B45F3F8|nr:52 kDa repressor of the inhibitor of the protein kinase-like [Mizuhopecten yessoensis]